MCLLRWDRVEDLLSYGLLILGLLVLPTSLVTGRCMEVETLTEIVIIIFDSGKINKNSYHHLFHDSVECTIAEGNEDPGHQILYVR